MSIEQLDTPHHTVSSSRSSKRRGLLDEERPDMDALVHPSRPASVGVKQCTNLVGHDSLPKTCYVRLTWTTTEKYIPGSTIINPTWKGRYRLRIFIYDFDKSRLFYSGQKGLKRTTYPIGSA